MLTYRHDSVTSMPNELEFKLNTVSETWALLGKYISQSKMRKPHPHPNSAAGLQKLPGGKADVFAYVLRVFLS